MFYSLTQVLTRQTAVTFYLALFKNQIMFFEIVLEHFFSTKILY